MIDAVSRREGRAPSRPYRCCALCLLVLLAGLVSGGCASSGIVMTPSVSKAVIPDDKNRACYKIQDVSVSFNAQETPVSAPEWSDRAFAGKFAALAEERYPGLFKNDPLAIPVNVRVEVAQDVHQGLSLGVYICTLCIVGGIFPSVPWSTDWQVKIQAEDVRGGSIFSTDVQAENRGWWSILTPLGLMTCPGASDQPKVSSAGLTNGPGFIPPGYRNYVAQCLVDLLAADLLKQDASRLPSRPLGAESTHAVPIPMAAPPVTQPVNAAPEPMY